MYDDPPIDTPRTPCVCCKDCSHFHQCSSRNAYGLKTCDSYDE